MIGLLRHNDVATPVHGVEEGFVLLAGFMLRAVVPMQLDVQAFEFQTAVAEQVLEHAVLRTFNVDLQQIDFPVPVSQSLHGSVQIPVILGEVDGGTLIKSIPEGA